MAEVTTKDKVTTITLYDESEVFDFCNLLEIAIKVIQLSDCKDGEHSICQDILEQLPQY